MTGDERRVRRAVRIGLAVGLVPFLVILAGGRGTLLAWNPAGDFYDEQARALLDGRLDVDPDVLGIEAFFHDGRAYLYQPPFPALLRLPVRAVTDRFDGRLGAPSMLLAAGVAALALEHLVLEVRRLRRSPRPAGRLEPLLGGLLGASLLGAGPALFLASRPWVYHESAMWGLAWALAAGAALFRLRRAPSWWGAAVLLGAGLGAMGSRASVALGPLAAAGLLGVLTLRARWRRTGWGARLGGPAGPAALALAAVLPVLAYAGLNLAKFGSPASVPFEQQGYTLVNPQRQAMLAEHGGTLFGLRFAPTTLYHYLRPVGATLDARFPYVDFGPPGGPVVGDVTFDLVDRTASVPTVAPGLLVLGGVGVVALARRRLDLRDRAVVAAALAGGVVGCGAIVPFGYVAHRYLADTVPLLVVGGAVGIAALAEATDRRRLVAGAAVALVAVAAWANLGLGLRYQRLYVPNPDPTAAAAFVDLQDRAGGVVGRPPPLAHLDELPAGAPAGHLVALDGCAALYVSNGSDGGSFGEWPWVPLERTARAGRTVLEVDLAGLAAGVRHPLLRTAGDPASVVWAERDGGRVVVGVDGPDAGTAGPSRPVPLRGRDRVEIVTDPYLDVVVVRLGDQPLLSSTLALDPPVAPPTVGRSGGAPGIEARTPGARAVPDPQASGPGPLCQRLGR